MANAGLRLVIAGVSVTVWLTGAQVARAEPRGVRATDGTDWKAVGTCGSAKFHYRLSRQADSEMVHLMYVNEGPYTTLVSFDAEYTSSEGEQSGHHFAVPRVSENRQS